MVRLQSEQWAVPVIVTGGTGAWEVLGLQLGTAVCLDWSLSLTDLYFFLLNPLYETTEESWEEGRRKRWMESEKGGGG